MDIIDTIAAELIEQVWQMAEAVTTDTEIVGCFDLAKSQIQFEAPTEPEAARSLAQECLPFHTHTPFGGVQINDHIFSKPVCSLSLSDIFAIHYRGSKELIFCNEGLLEATPIGILPIAEVLAIDEKCTKAGEGEDTDTYWAQKACAQEHLPPIKTRLIPRSGPVKTSPETHHQIINLTPHAVDICGQSGQVMKSLPPLGKAVRLSTSTKRIEEIEGIPISETIYGTPENLPDYHKGTYYIVSTLVKNALPGRKDLLVPSEILRDEKGQVRCAQSLGR